MSVVLVILSLVLKVAGVVFLFAAALGLVRFRDALQRMHASTKTGTIGAGLVLAGTVLRVESVEGVVIGVLAIVFLLLTVPVAGHLLGRAAYVSGADLVGLEGKDALEGVLPRQAQPLEQRVDTAPGSDDPTTLAPPTASEDDSSL